MTTVAFAGLANSHPFTDAGNLRELRPDSRFVAWDPNPARVQLFLAEHPETSVASSVEELLALGVDVVIVTVAPRDVAGITRRALDAGLPVVITKPAATNRAELDALVEAVAGREDRVLTSSVLRFASAMERLPERFRRAHVVAVHDIEYWRKPDQRWQDDAGGLVPMMGVHAFELLEAVVGPGMRVTDCRAERRRDDELASPDVAEGTVDGGVVPATFVIDGATPGQHYTVEVESPEGETVAIRLGEGADPHGYLTIARHVLALADGQPSPLPWDRTMAVLTAVADAAALAGGSR